MFGQKRKRIEALDLAPVARTAVRRYDWSSDRVKAAEGEYRKFLYLLMLYPKKALAPWCDDLDLFWHEHILHTERYAADCQRLFGHFINHDPSLSDRPVGEFTVKFDTVLAFYRTFGRKAAKDGSSWQHRRAHGHCHRST